MNYTESLKELIKNKREISKNNTVSLSLGEVADAWGRNVLQEDTFSIVPDSTKSKHIDSDFKEDVAVVIEKLQDQKFIEFRDTKSLIKENPEISKRFTTGNKILDEISSLFYIEDKINLEIKEKLLSEPENKEKVILNGQEISFDDDKVTIRIGKKSVSLPPFKNEHFLCREMFEHTKGEPVDWSSVYEKITDDKEPNSDKKIKNRRMVYDAMEALNKRIKEIFNTDDDFFTFKEKTITRNY